MSRTMRQALVVELGQVRRRGFANLEDPNPRLVERELYYLRQFVATYATHEVTFELRVRALLRDAIERLPPGNESEVAKVVFGFLELLPDSHALKEIRDRSPSGLRKSAYLHFMAGLEVTPDAFRKGLEKRALGLIAVELEAMIAPADDLSWLERMHPIALEVWEVMKIGIDNLDLTSPRPSLPRLVAHRKATEPPPLYGVEVSSNLLRAEAGGVIVKAINELGEDKYQKAAAVLFGLTPATRRTPLWKRQELAREVGKIEEETLLREYSSAHSRRRTAGIHRRTNSSRAAIWQHWVR